MKFLLLILTSLFIWFPHDAKADSFPQLTEYLKSEISGVSGSVPNLKDYARTDSSDAYFFRRWFVRLQIPFGISVPWIAQFQVIPEVELVWVRSYPDGWKEYKPN